jgi:hypothetical protein
LHFANFHAADTTLQTQHHEKVNKLIFVIKNAVSFFPFLTHCHNFTGKNNFMTTRKHASPSIHLEPSEISAVIKDK